MIRIQDNPKQWMEELLEDRERAIYWFLKENGGEQKLEVIRRQLLRHGQKVRQTCHTYCTEFNSQSGNVWATYINLEYIPSMNRYFFQDIAFTFYMEGNDIYLFCPMVVPGEEPVCLIFTPGFFDCYRTVKNLDKQKGALLGWFIRDLRLAPYQLKGNDQMEIPLHEGVAKGFVRSYSPLTFQLTEYVSSPALTGIDVNARELRLFDLRKAKPLDMGRPAAPKPKQGTNMTGTLERMRFIQMLGLWVDEFFKRLGFIGMNSQRAMQANPSYYITHAELLYRDLVRFKQADIDGTLVFLTTLARSAGLPPVPQSQGKRVLQEIVKSTMS